MRVSCSGISFYKWMDNKAICLASNYHGGESTTVARRDRNANLKNVNCPTVVKDYNSFMGGVDHADQLRSAYGLDRKSKKWWHRIFWGLLEMAFINSYVVYCQSTEKIKLLQFRRSVALGLMTQKNPTTNRKSLKSTSRNEISVPASKRRRETTESVCKDVRLGNLGVHWPTFVDTRGRCELCSINNIQSKPYSKCGHWGLLML